MSSSIHRALLTESKGAPLILGTLPTPKPGPGQLLVKILATTINPVDTYQARGLLVASWPNVCGFDGAGIVEEVGEGVTGFAKGDRVMYGPDAAPANGKTWQEYALALASVTAKIPSNISFEKAATIPLCLSTAVVGLYGQLRENHGGAGLVRPWEQGGRNKYHNEAIVVIGGSTCVGQFAIQMAKMSGFSPIIATASSRNEEYCKAAGATHVIDYTNTPYGPALVKAVSSITTAPIKVIYDTIVSKESQLACWSILAPAGQLLLAHPAPPKEIIGGDGFVDQDGRRVIGVAGSVHNDKAGGDTRLGKSLFGALEGMVRDGDVKPSKVELLPKGLLGIPEGVERLMAGKVSGRKLVARIADTP